MRSGGEVANFYREFAEITARFLDEERAERRAAERAKAVSEAREHTKAAKQLGHEAELAELDRLFACGLILAAEYKRRRMRLLEP